MNARERLIGELKIQLKDKDYPLKDNHSFLYTELADFILADRARIVSPLIKIHKGEFTLRELNDATIEVLKLSGQLSGV